MNRLAFSLWVSLALGCGSSDSSTPPIAPTDATDDVAIDTTVADVNDAADVAKDTTTTSEVFDTSDAAGDCGATSCKSSEWCVIPCCGGADTGVPCTPPDPYCAPAGCSGSGCDSLCFGRSSIPDATKRIVTCVCA